MSITAAIREEVGGKIGQTKVKRYWPGKAPEWAEEAGEEEDVRMQKVDVFDRAHDELGVARKDDPRLRRLGQTRIEKREEIRADQRRIREAEIISKEEEEELRNEETRDEEEDEDALEERRRRIREKNLKRAQEEAALLPVEEEELQDEIEIEEESESEFETDSEEEDMPGITMIKVVFVPKAERDTIAERERLEAEEEALEELAKKKLEMRKVETKQIVVEEVRKDEEKMVLEDANIGDVETDDEINEAEEYQVWQTREIARIKRERDAKEAMLREREEIEKLRKMTEEERREWERKNPKPSSAQPKRKWNFLQKYYHKGAFFQDDGIFQRDFSAPTEEDRLDKSNFPIVMQVKHFGRSGRTKWTHLVNEDTTYWTNPNDPRNMTQQKRKHPIYLSSSAQPQKKQKIV